MLQRHHFLGFSLVLITPFIYILTILPSTKVFVYPFLLFFLVLTISLILFKRNNIDLLMYASFIFTLLLVGLTGWYFSPFFSWLYILAIALAFLYSANVTALFIAVLFAIFLPNIGSVDTFVDILTLLSMTFLIPLTFFLRMKYLELRENEKKILILEREHQHYQNKVEEVLSNRVIKLGADLREPVNDIRQIAYVLLQQTKSHTLKDEQQKIITLADKALYVLRKFEEKATGKRLVSTPHVKK